MAPRVVGSRPSWQSQALPGSRGALIALVAALVAALLARHVAVAPFPTAAVSYAQQLQNPARGRLKRRRPASLTPSGRYLRELSPSKASRLESLLRKIKEPRWRNGEFRAHVAELREDKLLVHPKDCTQVISAAARRGMKGVVLGLLEDMRHMQVEMNGITYGAAQKVFEKTKDWRMSMQLMQDMQKDHVQPTVRNYNAAISACSASSKWQAALGLFEEVQASGLEPTEVTYAAMLSACRDGQWQLALDIKDRMLEEGKRGNLIMWCTLMKVLEKSNQPQLVLDTFHEMKRAGFQPDRIAYQVILRACGQAGAWQVAEHLMHKIRRDGYDMIVEVQSALVCAYAKDRKHKLALKVFRYMVEDEVDIAPRVYLAAYAASRQSGNQAMLVELERVLTKKGIAIPSVPVEPEATAESNSKADRSKRQSRASAEIEAACKNGDWQYGLAALRRMKKPAACDYRHVMQAAIDNEEWDLGLKLFNEAIAAGISPDIEMFLLALDGHAEGGQWEEATALLQQAQSCGATSTELFSKIIRICSEASEHGWVLEVYDELRFSGLPVDADSYELALRASWVLGLTAESQELRQDWLELELLGNDASIGQAPSGRKARGSSSSLVAPVLPPALVEIQRKERRGIEADEALLQAGIAACSRAELTVQAEALQSQLQRLRRKRGGAHLSENKQQIAQRQQRPPSSPSSQKGMSIWEQDVVHQPSWVEVEED